MSPGMTWIVVIVLVGLAIVLALALAKAASVGDEQSVLDEYVPNERCVDCGLEIENSHAACQGHQWCYPECPRCGGSLVEIEAR